MNHHLNLSPDGRDPDPSGVSWVFWAVLAVLAAGVAWLWRCR